jgi:hypothetical protein
VTRFDFRTPPFDKLRVTGLELFAQDGEREEGGVDEVLVVAVDAVGELECGVVDRSVRGAIPDVVEPADEVALENVRNRGVRACAVLRAVDQKRRVVPTVAEQRCPHRRERREFRRDQLAREIG